MKQALLLLCLAGCSSGEPDSSGDVWAEQAFGKEVVRTLTSPRSMGEGGEPYAPRPFVVLEYVSKGPGDYEGPSHIHPLNPKLPASMIAQSAEEIQSLVWVRRVLRHEFKGYTTIKRRTQKLFSNEAVHLVQIFVKDENGQFVGVAQDMFEGHEDEALAAYLQTLAQVAPAEE